MGLSCRPTLQDLGLAEGGGAAYSAALSLSPTTTPTHPGMSALMRQGAKDARGHFLRRSFAGMPDWPVGAVMSAYRATNTLATSATEQPITVKTQIKGWIFNRTAPTIDKVRNEPKIATTG